MEKIKLVTSLFLLLSLTNCAQKPNKMNAIDIEIFDHYKNHKSLGETKPGYYLQVNNQNCYYELRVNDGPSGSFYDPYPAYSQRVPINYEIFKSGEQKLSLSVFPYKRDTLSAKANIQLRLMRYPDMTDLENDFGGSTILWEWEMPHIGNQNLPFVKFDTVFKADVPYKIETLDIYASNLSKLDKDDLSKEVLVEFTKKRNSIINKTQDRDLLRSQFARVLVQLYESEEFLNEILDDSIVFGEGKEPQPIENYELRFYYNNRIVTLVKKDDKEPIIWFKNKEGTKISSQPYYIFKDKETGTWHAW